MRKKFITTIGEGPDYPYLGVFENEVNVRDFAELDKDVELISFNPKVKNMELLPQFKSIRYVSLISVTADVVTALSQLPNLEMLSISGDKHEDWPSFKSLASLKYLILYNIKKITTLDFLQGMKQLESLFVSEVLKLNDISVLKTIPNIREFSIEGNLHGQGSVLPDVEALFSLKKLEHLKFFSKKTELRAIDFAKFKKLKYLHVSPRRYPFEFYAELARHLPKNAVTYHPLFFPYQRDPCGKCRNTNFIAAVGARQREFCPACKPKKLETLLESYETLSGKKAKTAIENIPFLNSQ
ncbi:MAG: hypothetical protein ABJN69_08060 [Hellea sp.]